MDDMSNERYDVCTAREGKDGKTHWIRIGTAYPTKNGNGLNIFFDALPVNGRAACFPAKKRDQRSDAARGGEQADGGSFGGDDIPY